MRNSVDLPEPFKPNTPILAPGKKDKEIRKNVGIAGRGKKCLPQQVIDYIDEMEEFWNKTFDISRIDSDRKI